MLFGAFSAAMLGGIQSEMSEGNFWKGALLGAASSAATYGIGQLFGDTRTIGHELLRAGSHGLSSGVFAALEGSDFASAFISGASASGIGSFAQSININTSLMVASTTAMGGVVAWAMGGDFLQGALQGFSIGLLNHSQHDPNNRGQLFHGKKARVRAHKYMRSRSLKTGKELSAAYLENGDVLIFKEKGNTQTLSHNYYIKENGMIFVKINGKMVPAIGSVHTHPYAYGTLSPENPLGISYNDILLSRMFDHKINVLIVKSSNGFSSGVYEVFTTGNGLYCPTLKYKL